MKSTLDEGVKALAKAMREDQSFDFSYTDAVRLWDMLASYRTQMHTMTNPADVQDMQDLSMRIFALALPVASDADVLRYICEYAPYLLGRPDVDMTDLVRRKLLSMPFIEDRDVYRERLREALADSSVVITARMDQAQGGTLKEWLHAYTTSNSTNDSLQRAQFVARIQENNHLAPEEKIRVEHLVNLFDYLRLSSSSDGFEEEGLVEMDDKLYQVQGGRFTEVKKDSDPIFQSVYNGFSVVNAVQSNVLSPLEETAYTYAAHPIESMEADMKILESVVFDEKHGYSKERVLQALIRVCLERQLPDVFIDLGCDSLKDLFETVLVAGVGFSTMSAVAVAGRFVGRLPDADRSIHAQEVYFDMASGHFVWGEPVIIPVS